MTQPSQLFVLWTADECDMRISLHMTFVMYLTSRRIRRRVVWKTQVGMMFRRYMLPPFPKYKRLKVTNRWYLPTKWHGLTRHKTVIFAIAVSPVKFHSRTDTCHPLAVLNVYCWCDQTKKMELAGHVARIAEKRNTYRILVGKPEGTRPLAGVCCGQH